MNIDESFHTALKVVAEEPERISFQKGQLVLTARPYYYVSTEQFKTAIALIEANIDKVGLRDARPLVKIIKKIDQRGSEELQSEMPALKRLLDVNLNFLNATERHKLPVKNVLLSLDKPKGSLPTKNQLTEESLSRITRYLSKNQKYLSHANAELMKRLLNEINQGKSGSSPLGIDTPPKIRKHLKTSLYSKMLSDKEILFEVAEAPSIE